MDIELFKRHYYRQDIRLQDIADILGVSSIYSLTKIAKDNGLPTRRQAGASYRPSTATINPDEVRILRGEGQSYEKLAKRYGISRYAMLCYCQRHNIETTIATKTTCDSECPFWEQCTREMLWKVGVPCELVQSLDEDPNLYELQATKPDGHGMKAHFVGGKK